MNDKQIINQLMNRMFNDHMKIRQWYYGHNTHFGMSPEEMVKAGRSDEVISYLVWAIEGPF